VPFYVALPSSTFDWNIRDGLKEIEIEERDGKEVESILGLHEGREIAVRLIPGASKVKNYGFDVTPARLITGLITERGVCRAEEQAILDLFPEYK
jgi:methylthioribose-1-phosphate isomerase